jgi:pyruvate dehydrogenase (quinone)
LAGSCLKSHRHIVRQDLGFESILEIDFDEVFKGCSVYCEMIVTPEQARRKTVAACQAALTTRRRTDLQ